MRRKIKLKSESVLLGGKVQWIHYNADQAELPLLLFLHGGPGIAETPLLVKYCPQLFEHFLVVHWDQEGAGKSYFKRGESNLSVQSLVADGIELSKILSMKFRRKKLVLMGHSWGTALGILMCQSCPEIFHKYIGIGQVGNWLKGEEISYNYTISQAIQKKNSLVLQILRKIGQPPYKSLRDLLIQRTILMKYGGGMYGKRSMFNMFPDYFLWQDFSLTDFPGEMRGSFESAAILWEQCLALDLNTMAPEIGVPVCILTGRYDYQIPFACSEEYFANLRAPEKSWYWFENSAHTPFIEESEKFNNLVISKILAPKDIYI